MQIKKLKVRNGEWCEVKIELRDRNGKQELSISGSCGYVTTKASARKQALETWINLFEDSPEEIYEMNQRNGKRFTSPRGAAKYVIECDGEFHGVDVHGEHGNKLLITTGCGQIREEIGEYFPEVASLYRWHLNGMQAGCVHQALQGRTYATDPGHECPACGTKLGQAWYHWELPESVVKRVEALA